MKELFNNGRIQITTNGAGEIFIRNVNYPKKHELRIGTYNYDGGLQITCHDGSFNPTSFNGLGGFIIR